MKTPRCCSLPRISRVERRDEANGLIYSSRAEQVFQRAPCNSSQKKKDNQEYEANSLSREGHSSPCLSAISRKKLWTLPYERRLVLANLEGALVK